MIEKTINNLEAGQRLDKYIVKCLPNAGKSFIYKMLRKKNIVLNNSKADGSEKIAAGDTVRFYFSDETFQKFAKAEDNSASNNLKINKQLKDVEYPLNVLYEDNDIILVDKPKGLLSQKATKDDISLVEYITNYLLKSNYITKDDLITFHPGICNRLDRNTSGIVAAGKTVNGLQKLSKAFKERSLHKYYVCLVKGTIQDRSIIKGFLTKDRLTNKVTITKSDTARKEADCDTCELLPIETEYIPICSNQIITLLKVNLITGRSHQIRAHLASIGHPIIGDFKYGNRKANTEYNNKYGISSQMLHACELQISDMNLHVYSKLPQEFERVLKGEKLWRPGIQEDLEVLH